EEMARLTKKIKALDTELAKPSVYGNPVDAARVTQERATLSRQLDSAEARWMAAAEELEALADPSAA
ncbi:MAG: hypothetical protein CMP08_08800, partial [Xanthomonadales bacterium]|nr:hypothetical protein [Xanthomonadales bacterium]